MTTMRDFTCTETMSKSSGLQDLCVSLVSQPGSAILWSLVDVHGWTRQSLLAEVLE